MLGFAPSARFAMRLYLVPFLFCTICALPGSAQFTAGHALNRNLIKAPSQQGATMGTIGAQTAPSLQGATMGTIGPQGSDATVVTGVSTAGTVRINMLANLEALLNIITNGTEIAALFWGGGLLISALSCFMKEKGGLKRSFASLAFLGALVVQGAELITALFSALLMRLDSKRAARSEPVIRFWMACFIIKLGLLLPAVVNWLVASVRDANLLS